MLRIHKGFKYSLIHKEIIPSDSCVLVPMAPQPSGIIRKNEWISNNQDIIDDMTESILDALYSIFQQEYNININNLSQFKESILTLAYSTSWNRFKSKQYLYE